MVPWWYWAPCTQLRRSLAAGGGFCLGWHHAARLRRLVGSSVGSLGRPVPAAALGQYHKSGRTAAALLVGNNSRALIHQTSCYHGVWFVGGCRPAQCTDPLLPHGNCFSRPLRERLQLVCPDSVTSPAGLPGGWYLPARSWSRSQHLLLLLLLCRQGDTSSRACALWGACRLWCRFQLRAQHP